MNSNFKVREDELSKLKHIFWKIYCINSNDRSEDYAHTWENARGTALVGKHMV